LLFSAACERNRVPLLAVLRTWLPPAARVLEVGSGSGQHAVFFTQQLEGLVWQPSERAEGLAPLAERIRLEGSSQLAPGARLHPPVVLDVTQPEDWPGGPFDAVFSANTAHIMDMAAVEAFLAGSSRVLRPGDLLLLYGPFSDGGVHTAASNAAFDAQLRQRDPAMGVRDADQLKQHASTLGLEAVGDVAMPAANRTLIWRRGTALP
jgi:SAM-dependent methyltransferase